MEKTQAERWGVRGFNDRAVAETIIAEIHKADHPLDAIHAVMDALDYIRKQERGRIQVEKPGA